LKIIILRSACHAKRKNNHPLDSTIYLICGSIASLASAVYLIITDSTDKGSWGKTPVLKDKDSSGAWMLWETIAKKDPAFGQPGVFSNQVNLQKWYSFAATLKDRTFNNYMENYR
jgi:myosin-crossreactive antigen